jgi:hypothetical protein
LQGFAELQMYLDEFCDTRLNALKQAAEHGAIPASSGANRRKA